MKKPVSLQNSSIRLVLASGSKMRGRLLKSAGLTFETVPSTIDESAVESVVMGNGDQTIADLARILAEAKAMEVSARQPECFVLGCDQTLELDGGMLSKSPDMDAARRQLLSMRGEVHSLHSSAVLVRDGIVEWSETSSAHMKVRDFSPEFLGRYLALAGSSILDSVGGYQLEGLGIQLFDRIDGDYFTILGLPLMPVLTAFREIGILES